MAEILHAPLYVNAQIREIETRAFEKIPPGELMERAGKAAFDFMLERWPLSERIVVVCGPGNNGGDGYVLAKYARQAGLTVQIWKCGDSRTEEAIAAAALCEDLVTDEPDLEVADLIIDAYLGIGLEGDSLKSEAMEIVKAINEVGKPVFALDCPTGINTDTGQALGLAVEAEVTLTFIALKQGLFTGDAAACCGYIVCYPLDLDPVSFEGVEPNASLYVIQKMKPFLAPRKKTAHKGDFGHVLVIGGNKGFGGAAIMASEGALRTGAGLVSLATRPEHVGAVIAERPEIMAHGIEKADELTPLLEKATVIVLGPGLGQDAWAEALFEATMASNKPLIVDADALTLLSQNKAKLRDNLILTPHIGEASRLLGCEAVEIQKNRFKAVKEIQKKYGGAVILKGAGSLIVGPDGHITICPYGNPGMASGGMGDVLSGIIAGLVAQGFENEEAAIWGVYLHAIAADHASEDGERGMIASDVLGYVRELVG